MDCTRSEEWVMGDGGVRMMGWEERQGRVLCNKRSAVPDLTGQTVLGLAQARREGVRTFSGHFRPSTLASTMERAQRTGTHSHNPEPTCASVADSGSEWEWQ